MAVILFVVRLLAGPLKKYAVDAVAETAEATAEVEIRKHYRMIWASVLGAIAIAAVVLALKLL